MNDRPPARRLRCQFLLHDRPVSAVSILAFALSFDEVVVTTFTAGAGIQTLPQWILNNFSRPNVLPYVTVVATIVMIISLPIAWLAQRLAEPPNDKLV